MMLMMVIMLMVVMVMILIVNNIFALHNLKMGLKNANILRY